MHIKPILLMLCIGEILLEAAANSPGKPNGKVIAYDIKKEIGQRMLKREANDSKTKINEVTKKIIEQNQKNHEPDNKSKKDTHEEKKKEEHNSTSVTRNGTSLTKNGKECYGERNCHCMAPSVSSFCFQLADCLEEFLKILHKYFCKETGYMSVVNKLNCYVRDIHAYCSKLHSSFIDYDCDQMPEARLEWMKKASECYKAGHKAVEDKMPSMDHTLREECQDNKEGCYHQNTIRVAAMHYAYEECPKSKATRNTTAHPPPFIIGLSEYMQKRSEKKRSKRSYTDL